MFAPVAAKLPLRRFVSRHAATVNESIRASGSLCRPSLLSHKRHTPGCARCETAPMFGANTKDEFFFRSLLDHAKLCVEAAGLVHELFAVAPEEASMEARDATISRIDSLEHDADELVRKIVRELRETWILPLDREDIRQLAISLDDVIDAMEAMGHRMRMFDLKGTKPHLLEMCVVLIEACEKCAQAVALLPGLKKPDAILALCHEVGKLEFRADGHYRDGLAALYRDEKDPICIMKWSHVFEFLETAVDATNDVVDLLEGIVLEYA